MDELRILLADSPVAVLSINETRLDDLVKDSDVYIPGSEIILRDREINGRFGGGVCFYIHTNINYSIRSDLNVPALEYVCIEIRETGSRPFLLVTWYSPPILQLIFSHSLNRSIIDKLGWRKLDT